MRKAAREGAGGPSGAPRSRLRRVSVSAARHGRGILVLGAAVVLAAAPAAVGAQQPDSLARDTTVYRVEGIRVRAERPVTTVGGAAAIEIAVDSLVLTANPTTEEVLREVPMVHVRTNSRGEAEVTVRGSESRQVAVLYDGVPLTLGWDARTDVSVLPAGAASGVNVVRGLSSILHGPNVLGGVVELDVARQHRIPSRSLTASLGADDAGGFSGSVLAEHPLGLAQGTAFVRAGAGFRDSPGFALPAGVDEPVETGDGLRLNTDVRLFNGFVAARYAGEGGTWGSFSAAAFDAERGIGAELGVEQPRLWRYPDITRSVMALSGGTGQRSTPWGEGDLEASVGLDVGRTEIHSYTSRAYDEVESTEIGRDRTVTLRLLGDHTLGGRGDLRSSFTLADITHENVVDGVPADYQQRLASVAAEIVWRLLEGPAGPLDALRLSIGAAWDRATTPKTGGLESLGTLHDWGGRIGLSAVVDGGDALLHAGLSRRGRFPALRETYSEALDRFVPNPDLRPEHLVAFEAGSTMRVREGELQVVGFHQRLTGAIRRITLEDGRRRRVNADELESTGVEILVSQSFGDVTVGGDVLLQRVALTDPGTALSSEPENMPERVASLRVDFPVLAAVTATAEAEYTGPQFCQHPDTGTDVELNGGTWWNGILSRVWRMPPGAGLRGRVETRVVATNIGDEPLYEQCGLPRPGRSLQLQLRIF